MNIDKNTLTICLSIVVLCGLLFYLCYYNSGSEHSTNVSLPENMEEQSYNNNNDDFSMQEQNDRNQQLSPPNSKENQSSSKDKKVTFDNTTYSDINADDYQPDKQYKYLDNTNYYPENDDVLAKKMKHRDCAKKGEYKRSSYSGNNRGNLGPSTWDNYFDSNNNVIGNGNSGDNNNFLPSSDGNDQSYALFKSKGRDTCGSNQNCEPEDLHDIDRYLPQEVNDDWFEVVPEPISVKNRNLVNIVKPIGVGTLANSKRNTSHDIRGAPACPKFAVSPWANSSIEPDTNLKPLF
jgi:hypothetical protein